MIIFIKGCVILGGKNIKDTTQNFPDDEAERLISLGVAEKVSGEELTVEKKQALAKEAELIPTREENAGQLFENLTDKIKPYKELTVEKQKEIIQKAKTLEALEIMKEQSWKSVLPELEKRIKEIQGAGNE